MPLIPYWFLQSRRGPLAMRIVQFLAPFVAVLAAFFIAWQTEKMFFPVIGDWRLDAVERKGNTYVVQGSMRKLRGHCELINTSVVAVLKNPLLPSQVLYSIQPTEILGGNAPSGLITWGPWTMNIPDAFTKNRHLIDHLEIVGLHRCHWLWPQETMYGRIELERLP